MKLLTSDISILVESLTTLGTLASVILLISVFSRVSGSVSGSGNIGDTAHVVRGRCSEALVSDEQVVYGSSSQGLME